MEKFDESVCTDLVSSVADVDFIDSPGNQENKELADHVDRTVRMVFSSDAALVSEVGALNFREKLDINEASKEAPDQSGFSALVVSRRVTGNPSGLIPEYVDIQEYREAEDRFDFGVFVDVVSGGGNLFSRTLLSSSLKNTTHRRRIPLFSVTSCQ